MNWKLIFLAAYLVLAAILFVGAVNKIEQGRSARSDVYYAKDLALTLNEVMSAKGTVTAEYDYFPKYAIIGDCVVVGSVGRYCYIEGNKKFRIEKKGEGIFING